MAVAAPYRLPGVYFQVAPPPLDEALPRMDIAAFVGLASSGPIDVPVPIEDVGRFRDVFGEDLPLAAMAGARRRRTAHLGAAVEAFLRNGGRRCWVVRVAARPDSEGRGGARASRFVVPGLLDPEGMRPGVAWARSEGSWADDLGVGTVLTWTALTLRSLDLGDGGSASQLVAALGVAPGAVSVGDLLRLDFGDAGPSAFLAVEAAQWLPESRALEVVGSARWFYRAPLGTLAMGGLATAERLGPDGPESLEDASLEVFDADGGVHSLLIAGGLTTAPEVGDILRVTVDGAALLLPVEEVESAGEDESGEDVTRLSSSQALWVADADEAWAAVAEASPPLTPFAGRLSFEVAVWADQERVASLRELRFSDDHPRAWGHLQSDEELFDPRVDERPDEDPAAALRAEAANPRFPLAAPPSRGQRPSLYLPIGMADRADPRRARGPVDTLRPGEDPLADAPALGPDTALERDGVDVFSADLFLDPDLARVSLGSLAGAAEHKRWIQLDEDGGHPRVLGIHAVLSLDEPTLLCIPDAIHRGWAVTRVEDDVLGAPTLDLPELDDDTIALAWSEAPWSGDPDLEVVFTVQGAEDPAFEGPRTVYSGDEQETSVPVEADCPRLAWFRVRAAVGGRVGPWSNTAWIKAPAEDFETCGESPLGAPASLDLSETSPPGDSLAAVFGEVAGALGYEVQIAADPAFDAPEIAAEISLAVADDGVGTAEAAVDRPAAGTWYVRVRAIRGDEVGPWSATALYLADPEAVMQEVDEEAFDDADLLAIQWAALRMAAASEELVCVLDLPDHYRVDAALDHVAALRRENADEAEAEADQWRGSGSIQVPPLTYGERRALDFGAVYHPWVASEAGEGATASRPPSGPAAGTAAARALRRGAWVAPANVPLVDAVALAPEIDREGWAQLFEAQVNLVRRDPRGFMVLGSDTLADRGEVRPIGIRRLLILLRRLALREGASLVFESNTARLRRLVEARFDSWLSRMYERGAFQGATASEGYQVVADASVNTPQSVDQGRLIVELRVAPSYPMAFITVRLVQQGGERFVVEEV